MVRSILRAAGKARRAALSAANQAKAPKAEPISEVLSAEPPADYVAAANAAARARVKALERGIDPYVGMENSPDPRLHMPPEPEGGPAAVGGVAPAFSVFDRLQTFPRFRPRRFREVPIGNKAMPSSVDVQRSLQHLYHDLGVLVWDGCNGRQIEQIGSIITQTLGMGGPGHLIAFLRTSAAQHEKIYMNLGNLKVLPSIDEERTGLLAPTTAIQVANHELRQIMKLRQDVIAADKVKRYPLETQVEVSGTPPARGIIRSTILNPRYHQRVAAYSSLRVDHTYGRIIGTVELYTVGSAEFLSHVEIHYIVLQKTPNSKVATPVWGNRILQETIPLDRESRDEATKMVVSQILRPLWQLEREIWADRAQAAEEQIAERNQRVTAEKQARRKAYAEEQDKRLLEKERKAEKRWHEEMARKARRKREILDYLDKRRTVRDKAKNERSAASKEKHRVNPERADPDTVLRMLRKPMLESEKYGSNKRR